MNAAHGTDSERFLVTGSAGCIGAWVARRLLDEGIPVVGLDISPNPARLRLIFHDEELDRVTFVVGDIAEPGVVARVVADHGVTHVVHCAALQVPFVRADPSLGARVNVVGTVNVFEAVTAHRDQVRGFAFASSAAVFGPPDRYPEGVVTDDSPQYPDGTLYGVFKQANERTAVVYARDHGVIGLGLRPFVVYGPGRDQGMTSGPTMAVLAAVAGVPYSIGFRGSMYFNFAPDVATCFIAAARNRPEEPMVLNVPGITATVEDLVEAIHDALPEARGKITVSEAELPSPSRVDASQARALLGLGEPTPLREGVARTIQIFREGLRRRILQPPREAA